MSAEEPPPQVSRDAVLQTLIERSRTDFLTYVHLMNPQSSGFVVSKFHRYLTKMIQRISEGLAKLRQAVSVPPQHGKSTMLSVEAVAWMMGRFPGKQYAIAGYSQDLTISFARKVRTRIQTPLHLAVFPDSDPKSGSNRVDQFECGNGSALMAKSVGAKLTGRKVDYLIIDDPHAGRAEAESATQRKRVLEWYLGDCYTRLSPKGVVFIIGTRFHPEDLIGSLTEEEYVRELVMQGQQKEVFDVTNLAAIAEEGEDDPLGRKPGEALFPEVRSREFLDAVKATLPDYEWQSQFQGKPIGHSGGQFSKDNIRYCDLEEVPNTIERVRAWDLALTTKQTSNYTVGAKCAYDPDTDEFYVMDIYRVKATWVKCRVTVSKYGLEEREDGVQRVGIEAVAGFIAAYQDLSHDLLGEVKVEPRYAPKGDKLTRATPWLNKIQARRFILVRGKWNKEYISELNLFPDGTQDDQVDATSIAWEMLTWRWRALTLLKQRSGRPITGARPSSKFRPTGSGRALEMEKSS